MIIFKKKEIPFMTMKQIIYIFMALIMVFSVSAGTFWIEHGESHDLDTDVPMTAQIDDEWETVYIEFLDEWHVLGTGECTRDGFYEVCYIRNEHNVSFGGSDYVRTAV